MLCSWIKIWKKYEIGIRKSHFGAREMLVVILTGLWGVLRSLRYLTCGWPGQSCLEFKTR